MNGMNMNMNMQNVQNMNGMNNMMPMNSMNNMNNMSHMSTMNGMNNMNNMNGMKINGAGAVGAGYPMATMPQHFTGMPGQQQGGQQPQQQFMMQGMAPQFAPQRLPQGMQPPQQQPQPQPQAQTQHQAPTVQPQQQFQEIQFNGQAGTQQPTMPMMTPIPKSAVPPSVIPQAQRNIIPPGSTSGGVQTPTNSTSGGPPQQQPSQHQQQQQSQQSQQQQQSQQPPQQQGQQQPISQAQQRAMAAGSRQVMRTGVGAAGASAVSMGVNSGNMNVNAAMNYRRHATNTETLKFLDFCELVGVRSESTKNILYWKKIITEYFSENGVMRYAVKAGVDSRQFEFSVPIIPRFFFSIIQSGVTRIEIQPGMLRTQVLPNGTTYLESPRCCFTHHYSDGSYVNIHGSMNGILNQALRIDWLDFQTHVFIPGVEWPSLEKLLSDETKMKDVLTMLNESSASASPRSKNGGGEEKGSDPNKLKVLQKFRSNFQVFHSMSNFGLQESVMRVMQVSDVMAHLKSLMLFSMGSSTTGPLHALDDFVALNMKNAATPTNSAALNVPGSAGPGPNTLTATAPTTTAASAAAAASSAASNGATGASTNNNSAKNSENVSQKNSPSAIGDNSPRVAKVNLDLSQSTLNKRRRKSTVGELSPKSLAESPKPKTQKKTRR